MLDRAMRAAMRLPGALLDGVDGEIRVAAGGRPDAVYPQVRDTARHPESRLALEEGLHHACDPAGVLAWQHRGRTAFAIGGLNAAPEGRDALLRAFVDQAEAAGVVRQLAFPVRREELAAVVARGFQPVQVGVESILDVEDWTLRGGARADLRQMVNRARARGVAVEEVSAASHRPELEALYAAWLASRRPSWRMKLLVGSPSFDAPFDRRYLVARTPDRIEAFCTLLPSAPGLWGLDVMCRRPNAVPGSMERLLAAAADRLRDEGAHTLSLGANPMAGVPVGGSHPVLQGIFRLLYDSPWGDRVFGFRRLHHFKRKLRPREEPLWFAARPHLGVVSLYRGCRMWGLY